MAQRCRRSDEAEYQKSAVRSGAEHRFAQSVVRQDIRINFGDPVTGQTGRLFLPLNVRPGKKLSDNVAASLEIGVPIIKDYPVYNFKSQFRLNITW